MHAETRIVNAIKKYLRIRGYFVVKIHGGPYQMSGLPDILAIKDGRATWIETKRPGCKPTAIQCRRIEQLRNAGCTVVVATDVEFVKEVLDEDT